MNTQTHHHFSAAARAVFLLFLASSAHSQNQTPQVLKPVTVTGQAFPPAADVTGFGDLPLRETPVSASVIDSRMIEQSGARRLADLTRFDASIADAYNAPGYWDFLSIRGYVLDNDYNYRREGLPISAETAIPLDNKERIEVLRGTSGMQAGISAPGGLVNYVVKRPTNFDLREVRFEFTQRASLLAAADLGGRFGADGAFGYRINVAQERLRPLVRNLDGSRSFASAAGDWRLPNGGLLEGEVEWSRKQQGSQSGFSLLGGVLPAVPDPRLNLNNQPWVQPTEFGALTGTLRYSQPLSRDWRFSVQAGSQRLRTDDYTAFPFGCSAEENYTQFCSDGTFDYYDYRSVGETRRQNALALEVKGKATTGSVTHDLAFGMLRSTAREVQQDYAYNWAGVGHVSGTVVVPPAPGNVYAGTRRDERTTEFFARDMVRWTDRFSTWFGVRHTRLDRRSIEGEAATAGYSQSLTAPWAAVSFKLTPASMLYASWGQGVESDVVPNNPEVYANPGAVLPALKSRQVEVGIKGAQAGWSWHLDAFDIRRPLTNLDTCQATCVGRFDGIAHHRGAEAAVQWTGTAWRAGGTAMWLRARREGSIENPALNGMRPMNVPDFNARAWAGWRVPGFEALELQGSVVHEGRRAVLEDESIMLPAWTRFDAALRYTHMVRNTQASWVLGVDNVTNRRYWRESPYQFSHVYLYPGAPRTVRLSLNLSM